MRTVKLRLQRSVANTNKQIEGIDLGTWPRGSLGANPETGFCAGSEDYNLNNKNNKSRKGTL